MSPGNSSSLSSIARRAPIGFAAARPALGPGPRSLLGGLVILAAVPLLWSWFALALRLP